MRSLHTIINLLLLSLASVSALAVDLEKLAKSDWIKLSTANFELITDADEKTARYILNDLESFRYFTIDLMKLNVIQGLPPLKIMAIEKNKNFNALDLPDNWAGLFTLSIHGYAAIANVNNYRNNLKAANFARHVLLHEYVHHLTKFTHTSFHYPKWFEEGYAEYMATFSFDGKDVFLGNGKSMQFRAPSMMNAIGSVVFDSKKLLTTTSLDIESKKMSDQLWISQFYAQSFFLLHYFNASNERKTALNQYLLDLNKGYPQALAFTRAFNMTYEELDKDVKSYLNKGMKMRIYSAVSGTLTFPVIEPQVSSLSPARFYAELSAVLLSTGVLDGKGREQLIGKALELNPDNIDVKVMAVAQTAIGQRAALMTELESRAPEHPLLLTLKGDERYAHAEKLRQAGDASWQDNMKQARRFYRRAISLNPLLPRPYLGLGKAYDFLPASEPLQEGAAGYEYASLYERDERIFANYADMFIRADKPLDALPIVRNAVAFAKQTPDETYVAILNNLEFLETLQLAAAQQNPTGLVYDNGCSYEGPSKNNKPDGSGKITHPNGSYYQGSFVNGVMHGQGKLVSSQGLVYQGEFKQGIMKGKARIDYVAKDGFAPYYQGEVYYAMPQGKGTQVNRFGSYTGDYWYSWRHGQGEYHSADGKIQLTGHWHYQRYVWPEQSGEVFIGGYDEAGLRHAAGICRKPGSLEWCEYKNGQRVVVTAAQ